MMPKRIAVTGGIACGKSTVAEMLREFGGEILDTDCVTHDLESPGGAAVSEIEACFGKDVIAAGGEVDRRRLGAKVFADREKLSKLNTILHPLVAKVVDEWLNQESCAKFKAVLVPLLYEAGFDKVGMWDKVLAVVCSHDEQVRRLKGRGFSEAEAEARIAAQMPCAEKAARADCVIWNDADIPTLKGEVAKAVKSLLA